MAILDSLGGKKENSTDTNIKMLEDSAEVAEKERLSQLAARQRKFILSDTRAALAEQGLDRQAPGQFSKAYQRAEAYEAQVLQALQAKRQATLKGYQEEIKRLDKEIPLLEEAKEKKGLTVSDVMQIEQTIERKRGVVRELHEKVTAGIAEEMELTQAQEEALLAKKASSDADALEEYFARERKRIHQKHGHLWKFW